jgi:hypothetical protein
MAKKTNDRNSPDYSPEGAGENSPEIPQSPTAPVEQAQKTPVQETRPARLVYVGPNVPGGILQRFQVFKGGLPPYCNNLLEKIPELKELFVPVEGLEATRQKIAESGTNEARLFYLVQSKLNKGVK